MARRSEARKPHTPKATAPLADAQLSTNWPPWILYLAAAATALLPFFLNFSRLADHYLGSPSCDMGQYRSHLTFAFRTLRSGELPLWCPHTFCGTVFFPSTHATIFSPINFPLLFLLPQPLSVNLCILAHAILLSVGTAWYLRQANRSDLVCLTGAALAAGGGFFISRVYAGHFTIMSTLPWFPFLFGRFERMLASPTFRNALLFAAIAALMYFGGHSQYAYYAVLLLGARLLLYLWTVRRSIFTTAPRILGMLGLATLTAACLAAIELVPVAHATLHSARSIAAGDEWRRFFSYPPENLLGLFSPGGLGVHPSYYGRWYWWEVTPYIGIGALAIVLAEAALQLRDRRLSPAAILMVAAFTLSLASYVPGLKHLLGLIPGWGLFRGHAKLAGFGGWFACIMAAYGLDRLRAAATTERRYFLVATAAIAGLACAGIVLATTGTFVRLIHSRMLSSERLHRIPLLGPQAEAAITANLVWYWSLAAAFAVGTFILVSAVTSRRNQNHWPWALSALLVADILLFAMPPLRKMLPASTHNAPAAFWQYAAEIGATDRVDAPGSYESQGFGAYTLAGQDINISRYYNTFLAAIEGEEPSVPQLTFAASGEHPLLDIANLSVVALRESTRMGKNLPIKQINRFSDWNVFRRDGALPRAYVVTGSKICDPDENTIYAALRSGQIDFRREVLLSGDGAEVTDGDGSELVPATVSYTGTRKVTVKAPSAGWLVISESYYPLWHATVAGKSRAIVRANGGFRAVKVQAGDEVVFQFRFPAFTVAAWVSALSWLALLGSLLPWRKNKQVRLGTLRL